MTDHKSSLIDLPENSDDIFCPECEKGKDRDEYVCYYCDGLGMVSERHYNDIKSLERDESDL